MEKIILYEKSTDRYKKLILIATLCLSVLFNHTNLLAQKSETLTLNIEREEIIQVFKMIEESSDFNFLFSDDLDSKDLKVTLKGSNSVEGFLQDIENQIPLEFRVNNKNVSVSFTPKKAKIDKSISGKVVDDATNEAMPGVNILIKGTTQGTVTDANGEFSLVMPDDGTLIFSFIGYTPQEVQPGQEQFITIRLISDITSLQEVVVTALGIEREEAQLGYSVQKLNGDDINKAREVNILNSLSGKIAGVSVVNNPSGLGGSARVTIRGERSLNINKNQPLFIVDGVPVINELIGSSGRNNNEVDYGNTAGMINPDDVESISVLKGPNAAALYGSRGQNGVIIIKTKSGKGTNGVGIAISSTVTFEKPLVLPEFQNVYGQGTGGLFAEFTENAPSISWGPKMEGQLIKQFDSPTTNGFRGGDIGNTIPVIGLVDRPGQLAARGEINATPFSPYPNNVKDFFETGVTYSQNIAVTSGSEKGSIRGSYTYMDQQGMLPNTDLKRHTFAFSTDYKITPKLSFQSTTNYNKSISTNRPNVSYNQENLMYYFIWVPRSVNTLSLRNYWQAGREGLNQFTLASTQDNPYINSYENTNGQELDRVFGNVSATYKFTDWLSLMARVGTDYTNEFRDRRRVFSMSRFLLGSYREEKVVLQETNADFLLSFNRPFSSDVEISLNIGGNTMYRTQNQSDISAPQLVVPGVFTLGNSRTALEYSTFRSEKLVNSLYAFSQISFRDIVYLDLSARNDWSSTLPTDNRSYFYPSASASIILSEIFDFDRLTSSTLNFAKLRIGYAEVGNDTDPYQLTAVFTNLAPAQGQTTFGEPSLIPNADLKPERSRSYEVGTDLKFFKGRVGLDVAAYMTRTENQILSIRMSNATGYGRKVMNAGLVENKGWEATLNLIPVKINNSFAWSVDVNFSKNRGKVLELYTDPISGQKVENHVIASRYINVEARVDERMGDIYGKGYVRVSADPNDPYYDPTGANVGKIVYNATGAPLATAQVVKLGNYNPDWMAGIYNTFSFKGISLGFLFDVRYGGEIYSHTNTIGRESGTLIETLEGRENGYDLTVDGNGIIGEGVVPVRDAEGIITAYAPNTVKVSSQEWNVAVTGNRQILEAMLFDASFVKLREVKLTYALPKVLLKKTPFAEATVSLVGRNLAVWSDVPHIDPETSSTAGGTLLPGVDSMSLPTASSYGFNVSLKF